VQAKTYHWKSHQLLVENYRHDFDQVKELFEYNPWISKVIDERVSWLDNADHLQADRSQLIEVLKNYNQSIHNKAKAFEAISSLDDDRTLVVVGGQQAGLLTGPLLVIYKAITLIQTARNESARLKRNVIPVFWIAGEDHDFDEVNHTYCLSQQVQIEKIKLDPKDSSRSSVSDLRFDASDWQDVLDQLDVSLIETEFKADIMNKLRQYSENSRTLTDFFARILAGLFGDHGLIMLDSGDPALRKLEGPMFGRLIESQQVINESLLRGKDKVKSLGFEPQAEVHEGQANLFIIHEGKRILLKQDQNGFSDKKEELFFSKSELLEIAKTAPEKLSNNVFTRPLMQEFLFPVLHTVLGPGEIAYWGMLKEAFRSLKMEMPIIMPRREITLLEGTIQKHMDKYELSFEDVVLRFEDKKKAWLSAQDNLQLEQKFMEVKEKFQELYDPVLDTVAEIHSGIRKLGETNKQKILEQIDFLQSRATDAFESQYEASLRQLERIHLSLNPLGKPQERVYNVFSYLNKYGSEWVDELIDSPAENQGLHTIYYF
jgi:bacillithiol biosynthesis cysteine-adding enzyme BshC